MPYYPVVEYGNRLPSTRCKPVAKMPHQARCCTSNNGWSDEDLSSLEPLDAIEDIPNPKVGFQPEQPPLEYSMMTRLQSHVLNIPWIMDDVFLCSPVPNNQITNKWGGPPDWVVLLEGGCESAQADTKTSTRLPIKEGCLYMPSSCIGNGTRLRPWPASSADLALARRRTGSRRRRMEQRWLLGGQRSGALEEGRERRTRVPPAEGEA